MLVIPNSYSPGITHESSKTYMLGEETSTKALVAE